MSFSGGFVGCSQDNTDGSLNRDCLLRVHRMHPTFYLLMDRHWLIECFSKQYFLQNVGCVSRTLALLFFKEQIVNTRLRTSLDRWWWGRRRFWTYIGGISPPVHAINNVINDYIVSATEVVVIEKIGS